MVYQHSVLPLSIKNDLWAVNNKMDQGDLRHSAETGNWMHMENLKCNNPDSEFFGQNIKLYAEEDYYNDKMNWLPPRELCCVLTRFVVGMTFLIIFSA